MGHIKNEVTRVFYIFLNEPGACIFVTSVFALVSILCLRMIISSLLEMHKSKSTMKKIAREYSFFQKVLLMPAWKENEHAIKFCKFLVVLHHIRVALWISLLLLMLIASVVPGASKVAASLAVTITVAADFPIIVLNIALDRYSFKRFKHEYRFRKYHNTKDHDSLF